MYWASKDLTDANCELSNVRYHLDLEQKTPTERNQAVTTSDEMQQKIKILSDHFPMMMRDSSYGSHFHGLSKRKKGEIINDITI